MDYLFLKYLIQQNIVNEPAVIELVPAAACDPDPDIPPPKIKSVQILFI